MFRFIKKMVILGAVVGAVTRREGDEFTIRAARGVILTTGGFTMLGGLVCQGETYKSEPNVFVGRNFDAARGRAQREPQ